MKFKAILAAAAICIAAVSCTKTDVTSIAGTYNGTITTKTEMPPKPAPSAVAEEADPIVPIIIETDGSKAVKITFPASTGMNGKVIPAYTVSGIAVEEVNGDYLLSCGTIEDLIIGETNYTFAGLTGTVKGNKLHLEYTNTPLKMAGMGMKNHFTFDGAK